MKIYSNDSVYTDVNEFTKLVQTSITNTFLANEHLKEIVNLSSEYDNLNIQIGTNDFENIIYADDKDYSLITLGIENSESGNGIEFRITPNGCYVAGCEFENLHDCYLFGDGYWENWEFKYLTKSGQLDYIFGMLSEGEYLPLVNYLFYIAGENFIIDNYEAYIQEHKKAVEEYEKFSKWNLSEWTE